MLEALTSLIALQALDTAADTARKRIGEMPALEKALDKTIADAKAVVDGVTARLTENETSRRALEKKPRSSTAAWPSSKTTRRP